LLMGSKRNLTTPSSGEQAEMHWARVHYLPLWWVAVDHYYVRHIAVHLFLQGTVTGSISGQYLPLTSSGWMDGWLSRNWSITLGQELQIQALETWCASLGERTNQRRGKPVPPPGWLGKGWIKMISTAQLWVLGHMLQHSFLHVEMTHLTLVSHAWRRPGSLNLRAKDYFRTDQWSCMPFYPLPGDMES
jgi:hypothetical protein